MKKIWKIILFINVTVLLLPLSSFTVITANSNQLEHFGESNPMDNIEITCRGPIWPMIILRGNVFTIKVANRNDESYTYRSTISVRKPDGNIILGPVVDYAPDKLEPNIPVNYHVWSFRDFREAGCLFGFFFVIYKLEIWPEDGSYHTRTKEFLGFIFIISAIILNQEGKVIE